MNKKIIIQSILIALVLSIVLTVVGDFLFTRSAVYSLRTDEWQKMEDMSYRDAMNYMNEHKIEQPYPRNFIRKYQDIGLLKVTLKLFALHFTGIFLGCLILARFQARAKK